MTAKSVEQNLDALKEIFNIGVGGAATALYKFSGVPVLMTVPEVSLMKIDDVMRHFAPLEKKTVAIYVKVYDNFPCGILLFLEEMSAKNLVGMFSKDSTRDVEEKQFASVLKELSNIITCYFLNSFSKFIKMPLIPSVPCYVVDMVGSVIESAIIDNNNKDLEILFVKNELFNVDKKFTIDFILVPEVQSLKTLFEKT